MMEQQEQKEPQQQQNEGEEKETSSSIHNKQKKKERSSRGNISISISQEVEEALQHVSHCLCSLQPCLPPSLLPIVSSLAASLNQFLLLLPPPAPPSPPPPPPPFLLNSLLLLHLLRALLLLTHHLRTLLLQLYQLFSAHHAPPSVSLPDDLFSLFPPCSQRNLFNKVAHPCFLLHLSSRFNPFRLAEKAEPSESVETVDATDLANRCIEAVGAVDKILHHLRLKWQEINAKLVSTVECLKTTLIEGRFHPTFHTCALLRETLDSFFRYDVEGGRGFQKEGSCAEDVACNTKSIISLGEKFLARKGDEVVGKLLDSRGPPVVGIYGNTGVGKTSLACYVACDKRIRRHFPGGTYWLSVGPHPDLISLQAVLWRRITGSKITFSSLEEGTHTLMSRFCEGLPALLVLDDLWDSSHVSPFLCFDGKDKGRLVLISATGKAVVSTDDAFVQGMEPLEEDEAISLFRSTSGWTSKLSAESTLILTALARKCGGLPRLIQAVASLIYRNEGSGSLPAVVDLANRRALTIQDAEMGTEAGSTTGEELSVSEHSSRMVRSGKEHVEHGGAKDLKKQGRKDETAFHSLLLPLFHALGEVHPCLQECFLDLAAFPKGEWVSMCSLVDIWGVGDGLEDELIFLVLSFLASRALLEWKLEAEVENVDKVGYTDAGRFLLYWRLANGFYELAQSIIDNTMEEAWLIGEESKRKEGKHTNKKKGLMGEIWTQQTGIEAMFNVLRSAMEAIDTVEGLKYASENGASQHPLPQGCMGHQNACIVPDGVEEQVSRKENPHFVDGDVGCRQPRSNRNHHYHLKDCRLFMPGPRFDQWIHGKISKKPTKLSVICGNMVELPPEIPVSSLKVALLSCNQRLRSISATAMKRMEQLIVLDLHKCTLLTLLPNSISTLQSLELLDLSSCTHLLSLPQSLGKLKNLRFLRLSRCLSLTSLPKSLGSLSKLVMLNLSMCVRLKKLPGTIGLLSSLQHLNLFGCYSLHCLPMSVVSLRTLKFLELSGCSNLSYSLPWFQQIKLLLGLQTCATMAIPIKLWRLGQIEFLHLCSLKNLTYLPQLVGKLQHLRHLNLSGCRALEYLPEDLGSLFLLQKLDLSYTAVRTLPGTLGQLKSLLMLWLRGCCRLLCLPPSISFLPRLQFLDMAECWDFVMIPNAVGNANSWPELLELDLGGCSIKQLPYFTVGALPKLRKLQLSGCQNLTSLPETFGTLTSLERIDFEGCKSLASLQGVRFGDLNKLSWLSLRNCFALNSLPVSEIAGLQSLKFLDVSGCSGLTPFPEPLMCCARENRFTLVRWGTVWH